MQPIETTRSRAFDSITQAPVWVARLVLWCYRAMLSPFLGPSCRFAPSCSVYASEALHRHGLVRGGWMAVRRLLRCHPFHPGGWDPVPRSVSEQQRTSTSAGSLWSAGEERTLETTLAAGPS